MREQASGLVTFGTSISQIMKSDLLDSPPSLEFWRVTVFLRAQPLSTKSMLFTSEPTRHAHVSALRQPTQSHYQTQGHENTSFHRWVTLRSSFASSWDVSVSCSPVFQKGSSPVTHSLLEVCLYSWRKNLYTSGTAREGGPSSAGVLQTR